MRASSALLILVLACDAHAQFGQQQVIEEMETYMPNSVALADLDGDADEDLLSAALGTVSWFANDGAGNFGEQQLIDSGGFQARCVEAADLDGDGDLDVVVAFWWTNMVGWYENNGTGAFAPVDTISTLVTGPTTVQAIDMDADLDLDVVSASLSDDKLAWYENDGNGDFGPQQVMELFYTLWYAQATDLDADGDIDLLCSSAYTDVVAWFENDGTNTFGPQQNIAALVDGANYAYADDLDGDGDNDVLSAAWIDDEIAWYENLGGGSFGPQQVISNATDYARFVLTADLDGDGDGDVLSVSDLDNKIAWYANDGAGNFGPQQIISTAAYWATSITTGDADGDGDLDVFSTSWEDDKVAWYENDGSGGFGPQVVLTTSAAWPVALHAADLDADGDADVLVGMENTNNSRIAWYENLGGGNMGPQREITSLVDAPRSLHAADLDGDGDPDMLSASSDDHKFAWYANDGSGGFGPQQIIYQALSYPRSIWPADIDGDGDQDVLCGDGSGIRPFLNDGLGNFASLPTFGAAVDLRAVDLDGDGDKDLLFADSGSNELGWAPNDGAGNFGPEQAITALVNVPVSVDAADLDGDGDPDVLASSYDDGMITWYMNDGIGNFGAQQVISLLTVNPWSAFAADFDLDGDNDVVSVSFTDDKIAWYQNDGSGVFGPQLVIDGTVDGAKSAVAADMDGDGDLDVVGAGQSDANVAWYENHVESPYRIAGTVFLDADLDGSFGGADSPFPYAPVSITPLLSTVMTGASGAYTAFVDTGLYDLESLLPDPLWTLTTPAVQTAHVTTLAPQITGVDFGWAPVVDTSIVLPGFTLGSAPCWAPSYSWLSYLNQGTLIEQGTITLVLDPLFGFIGSTPSPSLILGNTIAWDFDSLGYFETGQIAVQVQLPSPDSIGLSWTNVITVVTVDSLGDTTGVFELVQSQYVGCAYDPNDKQVEPQGYGIHGAVPIDIDWLTYTIRFQNTGTDTALNVMIVDPLGDDLDRASMQILGTSHALTQIQIEADGEAVFRFENILLPDSNVNEPLSHGFVKFRIRPLSGSPSGTAIENTAYIYFDLNAPVITNTTLTTLVDCDLFSSDITAVGVNLLQASEGAQYQWSLDGDSIAGATSQLFVITSPGDYAVEVTSVYGCVDVSDPYHVIHTDVLEENAIGMAIFPNPSGGEFMLVCDKAINAIELVDLHGRILRTLHGNGAREVLIERGDLRPGMYMVRVMHEGAQLGTARVVVE